ncbi:kelch-like protein 41 isoform X3 [Dendronephthya gigantea]|nr:kelch-like protein 41 isoform X3 [Dendronephthya gigantea]XP_028414519.1 kelch-like protein 41 isoform X3 [Dendronephthya gigantea]
MAARWEDDLQGYDVGRFQGEVNEDLLCSICQEVPKDPRLCQHKDHIFCFAHISRHLVQNSQTSPVCRDPLTQETLRRPTGFLKNYWEGLKIKCDHDERGCPDYVRLEHLPRHVEECGYAPVMCRNEGCDTEVNRRDIETHEKNFCQFRLPKCHDCKNIKKNVDETNVRMTAIERKQDEMKRKQDEMKRKQDEIKKNVDEIKASQVQMNVQMFAIGSKQDEMKRNQDEVKQSMNEMREHFEKIMMMMNQTFQGNNTNKNGASAMNQTGPVNNQDVIIIGGRYGLGSDEVLNTVEKYNIVEGKSIPLSGLNHPRVVLASCVYNNDVFVVGGSYGKEATDKIEVSKMNQHPLRWTMFDGKLPVKLSGHDVIVYQGKLYTIGGYDGNEGKTSNAIYEIALTPPYTAKLLTRMPEARRYHKAKLVNGKLFILGGTTTYRSKQALDSVVVYDFIKNKFKPCPSLPQPVCYISTVTWGHMIIVVGGLDKKAQTLNDVIMYDTESGRSERLPSMIYKRSGSSVVIMNDVIVVFGGWNKEQGYLNSVESFTIGGDGWKELPGMIEKRNNATAVVKPL